jgi:hypothetical protein
MVETARNSFKVKIMTCNPYALKSLQTIFAAPAPVKAFRGMGEGGYSSIPEISPLSEEMKKPFDDSNSEFICRQLSTGWIAP